LRPADALDSPLSSFSGGNQQKILFAKWLRLGLHVFLLDEPTQGVDVGAKAELHRVLFEAAADGAGVLLSSSDVDELVTVCDRVVVLRAGRVVAELAGAAITPLALSRAALGIGRADHDEPDRVQEHDEQGVGS
jgi:ribose transport system ATP-binding protein